MYAVQAPSTSTSAAAEERASQASATTARHVLIMMVSGRFDIEGLIKLHGLLCLPAADRLKRASRNKGAGTGLDLKLVLVPNFESKWTATDQPSIAMPLWLTVREEHSFTTWTAVNLSATFE
jgi:hypothetical protein